MPNVEAVGNPKNVLECGKLHEMQDNFFLMPRFKPYNYQQTVMLPVDFEQQILPGTLEYSLHYLVDNELDLSIINGKFNNDEAGRPAYDPALLLKIALLAYSRGVTSSRKIEALYCENGSVRR